MGSAGRRASWVGPGFAAVVAALVGSHLFAPHGGPDPIVLGVLPWDLAWHLAWMLAAGAAVVAMTSTRLWPDEPCDEPERPPQ